MPMFVVQFPEDNEKYPLSVMKLLEILSSSLTANSLVIAVTWIATSRRGESATFEAPDGEMTITRTI